MASWLEKIYAAIKTVVDINAEIIRYTDFKSREKQRKKLHKPAIKNELTIIIKLSVIT